MDEKDLPKRAQDDNQRKQKEEKHNAAVLHEKGVAFAFSTAGLPAEKPWDKFRENLRKAIAEGLPADAALKALTSDAAKILGVEKQLHRGPDQRLAGLAPRRAGRGAAVLTEVRDQVLDLLLHVDHPSPHL